MPMMAKMGRRTGLLLPGCCHLSSRPSAPVKGMTSWTSSRTRSDQPTRECSGVHGGGGGCASGTPGVRQAAWQCA